MGVEESFLNKSLYKLVLYLIKVTPMIMALLCILNTTLSYLEIELPILSYIGSISLVTLSFLYISSYAFKFCEYHRMFIHYIAVTWILNIIDLYIGIPVSEVAYFGIQLIIAGVCLFIILYQYVKYNKKLIIDNNKQH